MTVRLWGSYAGGYTWIVAYIDERRAGEEWGAGGRRNERVLNTTGKTSGDKRHQRSNGDSTLFSADCNVTVQNTGLSERSNKLYSLPGIVFVYETRPFLADISFTLERHKLLLVI